MKMRHALFAHVPHREHWAENWFTFGTNQFEIMGQGGVDYEHHHGHKTKTEWHSRVSLVEQGNEVKFKLLYIVVVSEVKFEYISLLMVITVGFCSSCLKTSCSKV